MTIREIQVTFENEGMQIVGMLHRVETEPPPPGVVFFHGCTGSRTEAHWLFVKLARHLAERGMTVLRFDFRGSGESAGRFEDMTLSGEISDGLRAFEYLSGESGADPSRLGILGLSMGGAVGAVVAGRLDGRVRSCAFLNPVARPFEDLAVIAQMRNIDVNGFPVEFNSFLFGKPFFDDLSRVRPLDEIVRSKCPVLVVNGTSDATVKPVRSREYVDTLAAKGIPSELFVIEGADHTFASVRWEKMVMEKVGDWFDATLTRHDG